MRVDKDSEALVASIVAEADMGKVKEVAKALVVDRDAYKAKGEEAQTTIANLEHQLEQTSK
jgi:hypothetical protein